MAVGSSILPSGFHCYFHCADIMSAPKKRTRDAAQGTGSSKSSSESAFVGNEVYVNRIPDPPCEGKMLREAVDMTSLVEYQPTMLEARYRYPILEDTMDSGMNFDLVDILSWESPWVKLDLSMPPSKRRKHADTDPMPHASASSYFQHYQKKHKGDIQANAILASKHGRVAAADLTLPFVEQMKAVPKPLQLPLYHRETVATTTTSTSVPNASAVTWLKRTEYITAKDERSLALTSAYISESLAQLDAIEQQYHVESPSSTATAGDSAMDVDSEGEKAPRDEADALLDSILGQPPSSQGRGRGATTSSSQSLQRPSSSTPVPKSNKKAIAGENPFTTDATKVLRSIEASFDAIASRRAIVHPSDTSSTSTMASSGSLRRSSGVGADSASSSASGGPYIVEEWDIFPNELVWPNSYLAVQSETAVPTAEGGDLYLMPLSTHTPTLLKPAHTAEDERAAHAAHIVPQRKKEILALYTKPQDEDEAAALAYDEFKFHAAVEAEATSLQPGFDTMGSFVFVLGPTTAYDADEDEESGVVYEGHDADQTASARRKKNLSLSKARVGSASFKNIDARVHIRPPLAETRDIISKIQHADTIKTVPVPIPDLETFLRNQAADTLRE